MTNETAFPEMFIEKITVKDEWESDGQRYRLVYRGAGPMQLQTINRQTHDADWRPERECYVHAILCSRIEHLVNTIHVKE